VACLSRAASRPYYLGGVMYSLILYFDDEPARARYLAELGCVGSVVSMSWVRACPTAKWFVWMASDVRDHALSGVITSAARLAEKQRVSPVIYGRALLGGVLPPDALALVERLQKEYAACYMRKHRAGRSGAVQLAMEG